MNPSGGSFGSGQPPAGWTGAGCGNTGAGATWTAGGQAQIALVTTGLVSAGTTLSGQIMDTAGYTSAMGILNLPHGSYSITSVVIAVSACTTPDVPVTLGPHASTELKGANTFGSSTSFNINLNNCPAGMNSIQYSIDPVTSVLNSAQSVVALDASSSATGVGVQLLDGNGNVFKLSNQTTFSGYNKSTGGTYTIPMKARYYQTGSTVGPGTANTAMTFTMTYL